MQRARQSVTIPLSTSKAVRVTLSEWRGEHTVEVTEAEARLARLYNGTGIKVVVPVSHLPELIRGLQSLQAEARRLGLLPDQGGEP